MNKEYQKEYWANNKHRLKERRAEYYEKNKEHIKEMGKIWRIKHRKVITEKECLYCGNKFIGRYSQTKYCSKRCSSSSYYKTKKKIVYDHYGNKCNCCGELESSFLQIDHVNNDGNAFRSRNNNKGYSSNILYLEIINNNFPDTFQILCANCNWSKKVNRGMCTHKILKKE